MSQTIPWDEHCYAAIADELNDAEPPSVLKFPDDFDPEYLAHAEHYALLHGLNWPPQVGDFDRYYERKHQ